MKKYLFLLTSFSLIGVSFNATAHPGHDHSFWLSSSLHAITALSLIGFGLLGAAVIQKRLQSKTLKKSTIRKELK